MALINGNIRSYWKYQIMQVRIFSVVAQNL